MCGNNIPKMVKPVPDVTLLLDTSGSMSTKDLSEGLTEIKGVIDSLGTPVSVYCGETTIHEQQTVWSVDEINLIGGGGTDMGSAIHEIAELESPSIMIVITDGYTGWPAEKPENIGAIIAVLTREGVSDGIPPWIEWIELD